MEQMAIDFTAPSLAAARAMGEAGMQQAADHAERDGFDADGALLFIVGWVRRHGPTSGEDLTDAAMEHGFRATDGRAFGAVFKRASKKETGELVVLRSDLPRRRGHGSPGGKLYGVRG